MSKKEKSEFSEEELELINKVLDESWERNPLLEERDKRWRRHKVDQLQGYLSPNEPFPEWEFEEGFRSLKKADQWLLGWIYYGSEKFFNYLSSFFYKAPYDSWDEGIYNFFLFAVTLVIPMGLLVFSFINYFGYWNTLGIFGALIGGGALIFLCLYFLWKTLGITIGQTIIGTALVIWISYLLIN